jgi:glycerophosphoryl diester phosphodiesterase
VVPWVVDSEGALWELLHMGVDGVVTNRPLAMLAALKERYRKDCAASASASASAL